MVSVAGIEVVFIAIYEAGEVPQALFTTTEIKPPFTFDVALILFVVEVPTQPLGFVQI